MSSVRRGLAITTIERQLALAIQMAVTVAVSRLLTPADIGVWGIAFAATNLLLGAREFATESFLIQRPGLSRDETRVAFTIMLLVTALISLTLALLAPWLAQFYREHGLAFVLEVLALAVLLEVVSAPLIALMRRDMAFGDVAIINTVRSVTTGLVTLGLALAGFGYMSFAWAWLAAAFLSSAFSVYLRPDTWVYRPRLQGWSEMLTFGGYSGANVLLYRIYEAVPPFLLGRTLSLDAVGIYNRATLVCQLPNSILLSGVGSVLLPAMSAEARAGRDLRVPFLRAVSLLTVLQWPALVSLAILAHSLVSIVLGAQWLGTVPLIQIMAIAALPSFVTELAFPVLVAVGAMRHVLARALIAWPISAAIIAVAVHFGLTAVALSLLVIMPLQAGVSLYIVRRHIAVGWLDLARACWKSAVITLASAAGPMAVVATWQLHGARPIPLVLAAMVLSAAGWLAAVRYTRHEMLDEITRLGSFGKRWGVLGRRPQA
ncbi:MAG: oligosaccharide flippase family protein [Hyphomicrobiaceae bacterium]|nr:oligosaccharide flippase family protein [Hyphomicrobiaceae bacterium]